MGWRAAEIRGMVLVTLLLVAAAPLAADNGCRPIEGVKEVIGPGRILLLGELHGTKESPAFLSAVSCHAVSEELSVTVALELPHSEEEAVETFLGSTGSAEDLLKILRLPFWAKSYQDGRTSRAMLTLLEDLRSMKQSGGKLQVVLMDAPSEPRTRDEAMAGRLLAVAKESPDGFLVALSGNVHNRTARGSRGMGERVLKGAGAERLTSLDLSHNGGTAWICEATEGCGPLRLRGGGTGPGLQVNLYAEPDSMGYHGTYHVGEITASPPAKDEGEP